MTPPDCTARVSSRFCRSAGWSVCCIGPPPLFSALRLQSTDLSEYADLRSFVLQQSRHFVLKRLRGTPSSITTRYYVSIYNNQHSKLEQPAQVGRFPVCSHQGTTSACISALMLLC